MALSCDHVSYFGRARQTSRLQPGGKPYLHPDIYRSPWRLSCQGRTVSKTARRLSQARASFQYPSRSLIAGTIWTRTLAQQQVLHKIVDGYLLREIDQVRKVCSVSPGRLVGASCVVVDHGGSPPSDVASSIPGASFMITGRGLRASQPGPGNAFRDPHFPISVPRASRGMM